MKRFVFAAGVAMTTALAAVPAFASGGVHPSFTILRNADGASSQCSSTIQKADAEHDQWDLLCGKAFNNLTDVVKVYRFDRATGSLGDLVVAWPKGSWGGVTSGVTMVFFDSTTTNCDLNGPSEQWFLVRVKAVVWGDKANPEDQTKYRGTVDLVKSVDCP